MLPQAYLYHPQLALWHIRQLDLLNRHGLSGAPVERLVDRSKGSLSDAFAQALSSNQHAVVDHKRHILIPAPLPIRIALPHASRVNTYVVFKLWVLHCRALPWPLLARRRGLRRRPLPRSPCGESPIASGINVLGRHLCVFLVPPPLDLLSL